MKAPNSNITVLIVDDEVGLLEVLVDNLRFEDFKVLSAGNGQEALNIIAADASRIDCILSDVQMPIMDGLGLLKAIKTQYGQGLKVILMSGFTTVTREEALSLGACAFVEKPFSTDDICKLILENI